MQIRDRAALRRRVSAFRRLDDIGPLELRDGVVARLVNGREPTMAVVELDSTGVVPEHSHHNEQLGLVLRGTVTFRIGDEERELSAGDTWEIPANVPHEVHAGPDGAVVVDLFSPPREDWIAQEP